MHGILHSKRILGILAATMVPTIALACGLIDLSITKKADKSTVAPGEKITYTIVIKQNRSGGTATKVQVTDKIPAGLVFVKSASSSTCSTAGQSVVCKPTAFIKPGVLPYNKTATFKLVFTVSPTIACGTVIKNVASVTAVERDTNTSNNKSATISTTVQCPQKPDISIQKSGPSEALRGAQFAYTLEVKNVGNASAANVVVKDTVPTGLTFVPGASSSQCTLQSSQVVCNLGTMNAGAVVNLTLAFTSAPVSGGQQCVPTKVTNKATVTTSTTESSTSNNTSDTIETDITCPATPNLTIDKTGPATIDRSGVLTYSITVQNTGAAPSLDTIVADFFDSSFLTYLPNQSTSGCVLKSNSGIPYVECSIGTFNPGQAKVFSLAFQVSGSAGCGSHIHNQADIQARDGLFAWDHMETAVTCPAQNPNLTMDKIGPATVEQGGILSYQLNVANTGNGPSEDTVVVDFFDSANLTYIPAQSSQDCVQSTEGGQPVIRCVIGTFNAGQSRSFTLKFQVSPSAICESYIANQADIQGRGGLFAWDMIQTDVTCNNQVAQCYDNVDNDGDGKIDFPQDPGCSSITDNDETDNSTQCSPNHITIGTTDTPDPVSPGQDLTYQITVSNSCSSSQTVTLTSSLDSRTVFLSASDSGSPQGGTSVWTNLLIPAGSSKTVTLVTRVSGTAQHGSTLTLNSTAGSAQDAENTYVFNTGKGATQCYDGIDNDADGKIDFPADPGCSSATDNDETDGAQGADLAVTKSGPPQIDRGTKITYTVTVTNNGPQAAPNFTVMDVIPSGLSYVPNESDAACIQSGTQIRCNNISLNAQQSRSFTLRFTVSANQACDSQISNTASILSSSVTDPVSSNNQSQTINTTVTCPTPQTTRASITKVANKDEAQPGDVIIYTVTLKNLTAVAATNVTITDTVTPSSVSVMDAAGGTVSNGNTITWTLASLGPNATHTIVFKLKAGLEMHHGSSVDNTVKAVSGSFEFPVQASEEVRILRDLPVTGITDFFGSWKTTMANVRPVSAAIVSAESTSAATIALWSTLIVLGVLAGGIVGRKYFL